MVKSGLTEKRMQDKRFRKTEEAILDAVYSSCNCDGTVVYVTRKAHIARTTFYRHHGAIRKIVNDYEEYLLRLFSNYLRRWRHKQQIRLYFEQMLLFIVANKKTVWFLMRNDGGVVIEKMIKKLEPEIMNSYGISTKYRLGFAVYRKEVLGLIEEWGKGNFRIEELEKVLNNMVYLTKTIRKRLVLLDN